MPSNRRIAEPEREHFVALVRQHYADFGPSLAAEYLRGWFGYFDISQYYRPVPELDEWIRRRVRMCY